MATGIVKFFNEAKGFGFIKNDETGKDVFVHVSGLVDKIKQEDVVTFETVDSAKGPSATEVKLKR